MSNINSKNKKGVSVLYAVFIMSILMAISFGISAILISQIKMLGEIGHSVVAFYAADSGIEEVLTVRDNPYSDCVEASPCYLDSEEGISYYLDIQAAGGECEADNYCIKSIGAYMGTKRAIEINY